MTVEGRPPSQSRGSPRMWVKVRKRLTNPSAASRLTRRHPHQVADPERQDDEDEKNGLHRPARVARDVVGDRVADQEREGERDRHVDDRADGDAEERPPGASRSSTSRIHPTFHSSGFQIGTGPERIGSTVPNATATTA